MKASRFRHTVRYLVHAVAIVSVPVEAATAWHPAAMNARAHEVANRLIDLLTPEIVLMGGLVLLAFVLIARRPGAH